MQKIYDFFAVAKQWEPLKIGTHEHLFGLRRYELCFNIVDNLTARAYLIDF